MGRITHELHAQHLADFRYYILYDIIILLLLLLFSAHGRRRRARYSIRFPETIEKYLSTAVTAVTAVAAQEQHHVSMAFSEPCDII
jgi:hypothetical protein